MTAIMQTDLAFIVRTLASDVQIRQRIVNDFKLEEPPDDPVAFIKTAISKLQQDTRADHLTRQVGSCELFRAVVRAFAYTTGDRVDFLKSEASISNTLLHYDPEMVARAFEKGALTSKEIHRIFPNQFSVSDISAIRTWAMLIRQNPEFAKKIQFWGHYWGHLFFDLITSGDLPKMTPFHGVVAIFASPEVYEFHTESIRGFQSHEVKDAILTTNELPGMTQNTISELLRNLGWDGLTPNTYLKRFLDGIFPETTDVDTQMRAEICELLRIRDPFISQSIYYSILASRIVGSDMTISDFDNLIRIKKKYQLTTHR